MTGLFILISLVILGSSILVVTSRNLVHAALWLISTLFGVAAIFILLNAGFLAVVQVVVYIGAISILMIFAIMLTRNVMVESEKQTNRTWFLSSLLSAVMFASIVAILYGSELNTRTAEAVVPDDTVVQLGVALVSPNAFVIPFEVASVLLLAALIGAIIIAWKK